MGAAGGASGGSLVSMGLGAYASILKGQGEQAANEMQAARAKRAADFGRVQANLTDATMRDELNTTLGNIAVIRAAGRIDPTSPTTAAIAERQSEISGRQRTAAVGSIRAQVEEDELSAKYLHEAAENALQMGYLGAAIKVAGGASKGFGGMGGE